LIFVNVRLAGLAIFRPATASGKMTIWILFAVMTTATTAILLHPLSSGRARPIQARGADNLYRKQLLELENELASGDILPTEYELARAETARRLFKESEAAERRLSVKRPGYWLRPVVVAFLPLLSVGLYVSLGSPDMPSRPLQARVADPGRDFAILVRKTEDHLSRSPNDGRGWDVIAPVYLRMGRAADSERAYRNALRLLGPQVSRLEGLAAALITQSGGAVAEDLHAVLLQILAIEPDNPRAKFYLALGQEQAGSQAEARSAFEAIARSSPADAPWLQLVNEHIAKNGGPIAATGRKGSDRPEGERGLSTTQSPDAAEPQHTIQAMVESLDSRLRAEPNNFDGFMRLVRSYAVLNERTRAVDALQRGLAVFPATGEQGKQLVALARELGIERE